MQCAWNKHKSRSFYVLNNIFITVNGFNVLKLYPTTLYRNLSIDLIIRIHKITVVSSTRSSRTHKQLLIQLKPNLILHMVQIYHNFKTIGRFSWRWLVQKICVREMGNRLELYGGGIYPSSTTVMAVLLHASVVHHRHHLNVHKYSCPLLSLFGVFQLLCHHERVIMNQFTNSKKSQLSKC